jgi:hypothetical protein
MRRGKLHESIELFYLDTGNESLHFLFGNLLYNITKVHDVSLITPYELTQRGRLLIPVDGGRMLSQ